MGGAAKHVEDEGADFGSGGGNAEEGISDVSEEETALRRVMLDRADRRLFLCDGSKLGVRKTHLLCTLAEIDEILCDQPLPKEILK